MSSWLGAALGGPFVVSRGIFVNPVFRGMRLAPASEEPRWVRKAIRVHDARALPEPPTLDQEGFCLVESSIRLDFRDERLVQTLFHDHCRELVTAATGCVEARVLQYEFRDAQKAGPLPAQRYAAVVHADLSPYVEDIVSGTGGRHFAVINVWRTVDRARPIDVMPLAVCDARTVDPDDIVYADLLRLPKPPTKFVDCRLIHDPEQRWYYFPRMTPNEALLFRQYDTRREEAHRRVTFHTAFADPTTPRGARRRVSVEARVLAVFGDRDEDRVGRRARFEAQVPTTRLDGSVSNWRYEPMVDWASDAPESDRRPTAASPPV